MFKIAYHPIYIYELPIKHRFPMVKYELLPQQLLHEGTANLADFFEPDQLTNEEILLTHSFDYLDKLNNLTITPKEIRKIGFPMSKQLIERGKYISKGTYLCAKYAFENGIAFNIAGGTHHSFKDRGEGFCIFNDIAISCNLLLARNEVDKILVVDLDVHQGNGTAKIFESDPRVFTFSMHGLKNYPTKKEKSDLDIELPDHTTDETYLEILTNTLPNLIKTVSPNIIFYLSGVDVLKSDKLGRLDISIEGCKIRDELVISQAFNKKIPIVCVMGGGYSPQIKDIIHAHANTFRTAKEVFY